MSKAVVFALLSLLPAGILGQNWKITSKIHYERFILLEGQIDSTYDITMYLEVKQELCGFENYANQWRNRVVSGWYYYDNIQAKIPLIGYLNWNDDFEDRNEREKGRYHRVELFVPGNYLRDTLDKSHCDVEKYSEKFFSDERKFSFEKMTWTNHKRELPVNLKTVHESNLATKAEMQISLFGYEMKSVNVSALTNLKYIERIDVLDANEKDDYIHITYRFEEPTNPGGSGGGQCGAGYEVYLGYLKLKKDWSVKESTFKQIDSCCCWKNVEDYTVEPGKPELGLIKRE